MFFCFISISSHPIPHHPSQQHLEWKECWDFVRQIHRQTIFTLSSPSTTKSTDLRVADAPVCYCPSSAYFRMCESCLPFPTNSWCQLSLFPRLGRIKVSNVFAWGWSKAQGSLPCPHLAPSRLLAPPDQLGSQELCQQLQREQLPALAYRLFPKVSLAPALRASVQISSIPKVLQTYS